MKSKRQMTRAQAEYHFVERYLERKKQKALAMLSQLTDTKLEEVLGQWDKERFGESFFEYSITPTESPKGESPAGFS